MFLDKSVEFSEILIQDSITKKERRDVDNQETATAFLGIFADEWIVFETIVKSISKWTLGIYESITCATNYYIGS